MCKAIFHLHFQAYFWNSLRALYFVQASGGVRPVRECSQERKLSKLRRRRILIQTLSLALWCHTRCKKGRYLNSILETRERNSLSWRWYFYCSQDLDHTIMFTRDWDEPGVDLISIDCTALGAASCSKRLSSHPLSPRSAGPETQRGPGCCNLFSILLLASSPPFLRHQCQFVALPWTCFYEHSICSHSTLCDKPPLKLVNNILPWLPQAQHHNLQNLASVWRCAQYKWPLNTRMFQFHSRLKWKFVQLQFPPPSAQQEPGRTDCPPWILTMILIMAQLMIK